MKHVESAHQQAYVARCRLHPLAKRIFAIPNGGKRSKVTAAIMKAEGVRPGALDLMLAYPVGACSGLFVEFKSPTGRMSKEQLEFADEAVESGHVVIVVEDWAWAWRMTEHYLAGGLEPAMAVCR